MKRREIYLSSTTTRCFDSSATSASRSQRGSVAKAAECAMFRYSDKKIKDKKIKKTSEGSRVRNVHVFSQSIKAMFGIPDYMYVISNDTLTLSGVKSSDKLMYNEMFYEDI